MITYDDNKNYGQAPFLSAMDNAMHILHYILFSIIAATTQFILGKWTTTQCHYNDTQMVLQDMTLDMTQGSKPVDSSFPQWHKKHT